MDGWMDGWMDVEGASMEQRSVVDRPLWIISVHTHSAEHNCSHQRWDHERRSKRNNHYLSDEGCFRSDYYWR